MSSSAPSVFARWLLLPVLGAAVLGDDRAAPPAPVRHGRYGVTWRQVENEAVDYFLPCERTEDARGLSPVDFDRVFPWSHIRLCNLLRRADGTHTITYRGEPGFAVDGSNGHVMVEIPRHYVRRDVANGHELRLISGAPGPGLVVDPAFVEGGREIDRVYVAAYEAHVNADGGLESVSGVYPTADRTRPEYRTCARANGPGYGTFDIRTLLMLQNLFLVEYADRNSQRALGNGWGKVLQPARTHRCVLAENRVNRLVTRPAPGRTAASILTDLFVGCAVQITSYERPGTVYHTGRSLTGIAVDSPEAGLASIRFDGDPIDTTTDMCLGGAAQKTGSTDGLTTPSGHGTYHGDPPSESYRCGVRYRFMENLWGNLWCFVDGLNLADGQAFFCGRMADYASGVTGTPYQPTAINQLLQDDNGNVGGDREIHYLRNLGYDPQHPWLALPQDYTHQGQSSVPGASLTLRAGNFGDYYYLNNRATCYVHGGGFDHYWRCGLFTLRGWCTESTRWYLYGSRLVYKPL